MSSRHIDISSTLPLVWGRRLTVLGGFPARTLGGGDGNGVPRAAVVATRLGVFKGYLDARGQLRGELTALSLHELASLALSLSRSPPCGGPVDAFSEHLAAAVAHAADPWTAPAPAALGAGAVDWTLHPPPTDDAALNACTRHLGRAPEAALPEGLRLVNGPEVRASGVAVRAFIANALCTLVEDPALGDLGPLYRSTFPGEPFPPRATARVLASHLLLHALLQVQGLPGDFGQRLRCDPALGFEAVGGLVKRLTEEPFWTQAIHQYTDGAVGMSGPQARRYWEPVNAALVFAASHRAFFSDADWTALTERLLPARDPAFREASAERKVSRVESKLAALVERPSVLALPPPRVSPGPAPRHPVTSIGRLTELSPRDPVRAAVTDLRRRAFPDASGALDAGEHLVVPGATGGPVIKGYLAYLPGAEGGLHVTYLASAPDPGERGIGESLMRAAIAEARRQGRAEVSLYVRIDNLAARALYEKLGFRQKRSMPLFALSPKASLELVLKLH